MKPDITSIIGFSTRRGRALLGFYGGVTAIVAVLTLPGSISPAPPVLALSLVLTALVVLTAPGGEPFAWRFTLPVVAIVLAVTALCAWNLRDPENPGYAAWNVGATTFLLLVLALRGRRLVAWVAFAGVAAVLVAASVTIGTDVTGALYTSARQAATLLVGTLFAILLRRTAHAIGAIQRRALVHASRDAATAARVTERATQNARLERDARPALERLLDDAPLAPEELEAFALLEQSLRDGIDAAGLAGDRLADEIRAARARGLRVVLVDDRRAALSPVDHDRVERVIVDELRALDRGTVTARLSPEGSAELATLIVDAGGEWRTLAVTADTVEVTRYA